MEDTIITIKRICILALLTALFGCNMAKLPIVSSKLESIFKEQRRIYKKQHIWNYIQGKYRYDRKILDSIFTEYKLQDSDEFYIIKSTNALSNYSLEIISVDKNVHLKFNNGYDKLYLMSDIVEMGYYFDFRELGGKDFYEFMKKTPQEELDNCSKTAPMANGSMVLFTYYNKGNIIVKRFETCDYAEYFNLESPKEED